jgi:hypothetical protein
MLFYFETKKGKFFPENSLRFQIITNFEIHQTA